MLDFQPYFWPQCSSSGVLRMQSNAGFCLFHREGLLSTLPTLTSRESALSKFVAVAFVCDPFRPWSHGLVVRAVACELRGPGFKSNTD